MKSLVDLHIHSSFSDGTYTVEEICALAVENGMRVFALSDHDTTDGLAPMAAVLESYLRAGRSIRLIPSIEMSSGGNGLMHVLGYGIRKGAEPLEIELAVLRRKRMERTRETIALLNRRLGTELSLESLGQTDEPDYAVGRMHVARLLIGCGIVRSVDEAFQRYLGVGRPAYIPLRHLATEDAIGILLRSRAVPVLAHPMRAGMGEEQLELHIAKLKDSGLMGLEVFHPSASPSDVKRLYRLARKHGLLITGGSDFHGDFGIRSTIGDYPSGWHTWEEDVDALQAAIDANNEHGI